MNKDQFVQALNESKDRNDVLKRKILGLIEEVKYLEMRLLDYEGEEGG